MRFMMLMYPNISEQSGENWSPSVEALTTMGQYNDELRKAGVLLELNGLQSGAKAVHIDWSQGAATVHDGPFAEAKEVVGGYWIIQTRSRDEAVEWAKRCPNVSPGQTVELRQIQEMEDFPADVREALSAAVVGEVTTK